MAIQIQGAGGSIVEAGAFGAEGLHTLNKPVDYGTLGVYSFAGSTGAIAAGMAANGQVFHFRWSDATRFAAITYIGITGMRATTAFAVGTIDIRASIIRPWTTVGSGGTALTLTGDNLQLRSSMGATLVGDARIASTAALTPGTQTIDSQDVGVITTHSSGGVGSATPIIGSIYLPNTTLFQADVEKGEHPIVLSGASQVEGIVVRATVPATGVWNIGITMKWAEVTAY